MSNFPNPITDTLNMLGRANSKSTNISSSTIHCTLFVTWPKYIKLSHYMYHLLYIYRPIQIPVRILSSREEQQFGLAHVSTDSTGRGSGVHWISRGDWPHQRPRGTDGSPSGHRTPPSQSGGHTATTQRWVWQWWPCTFYMYRLCKCTCVRVLALCLI